MPRFVAEEDTIRHLVAAELTAERTGSGKNPQKDWFDFMLATHGPWRLAGRRKDIKSLVNRERGLAVPNRARLYMSEEIDAKEIKLAPTMTLIEEFKTLGFYLDVIQYPAYVKMQPAKYATEVPAYLPNSKTDVLDENGEPIGMTDPVKWQDWKDANNEHREFDGAHYIPLTSNTGGNHLSVSMLSRLNADNFNIKSMRSYPVPAQEGEV